MASNAGNDEIILAGIKQHDTIDAYSWNPKEVIRS
jgi:hypothetical protein